MRDPKRIYKYCNKLAEMWSMVPDWRFGQLLCNTLGATMKELHTSDLFFPEDDAFFEAWEKVMKESLCNEKEV